MLYKGAVPRLITQMAAITVLLEGDQRQRSFD